MKGTNMKTYTIDRSKWANGKSEEDPVGDIKLYNPETGRSCCLGLILKQEGFTPDALSDFDSPEQLPREQELPDFMRVSNEIVLREMMSLNDLDIREDSYAGKTTEREREQGLKNLASNFLGVKLKFVGRLHRRKG